MIVRRLLRIVSIGFLTILVLILVGVAGLLIYEPSPGGGFAFSSERETMKLSDGRTLAYLDTGDPEGRPVFYFHGGPGSRLQGHFFEDLNRQLGVRMIAPDRPGYGLSDFQENRTYLDWPDDVGELADHLGIDQFAVLGWSSGGPHVAAVAHGIPDRIAVAAIVAGEGPYASNDFPQKVWSGETFSGSGANKFFIWSANNAPWLMRALMRVMRVVTFSDPASMVENSDDAFLSAKDRHFFSRPEFSTDMVEALRQGVKGWAREFTIERIDWHFELEDIRTPPVLVFHGEEDAGVDPEIAKYNCMRIPSCDAPTIYPGEGHSVVYYRYEDIIQAVLEAWE